MPLECVAEEIAGSQRISFGSDLVGASLVVWPSVMRPALGTNGYLGRICAYVGNDGYWVTRNTHVVGEHD